MNKDTPYQECWCAKCGAEFDFGSCQYCGSSTFTYVRIKLSQHNRQHPQQHLIVDELRKASPNPSYLLIGYRLSIPSAEVREVADLTRTQWENWHEEIKRGQAE